MTKIVKYDQSWRLHQSDLSSSASYLLAEGGEAVVAVAVVRIAIAGHVVGRWKDLVIAWIVRQERGGVERSGDWSGGRDGDLVNWSWGLQVSKTSGSRGLVGSEEIGLSSSNILGIVKEGVRDLFSLDIIVYRSKSSMFASNGCVKCGLELCLCKSNLGGVLEEGSSGSYSNNKDLKMRNLH